MAENKKVFSGLLNGIVRHDYYGDLTITDEILRQELYTDMPEEQFSALLHKIRGLIKSMAATDMDAIQAESFLSAQKRKQTAMGDSSSSSLTDEQVAALLKFWSVHRSRVHSALVDASCWSLRLRDLSWRVDVRSQARHTSNSSSGNQPSSQSAPCAIVQMRLENRGLDVPDKSEEVIQFELDETGLENILGSLRDIEAVIEKHSQTNTATTFSNNTAANGAVS